MLGRSWRTVFNILQSSGWQYMSSTPELKLNIEAVSIRSARKEDMPIVYKLIKDLAAYEGAPNEAKLSVEELVKDGFKSEYPWFFSLVAEHEGTIVGTAVCNRAYSTWTRRAYYIEDLFVLPEVRSKGVGLLLLKEICKKALEEGVYKLEGQVSESNTGAVKFYTSIGAHNLRITEGRAPFRLYRDCIEALAQD